MFAPPTGQPVSTLEPRAVRIERYRAAQHAKRSAAATKAAETRRRRAAEQAAAIPAGQTLTQALGIKRGDIYVNSWGYDQTNVDFYEVVRVTASKVELRPIGALDDSGDGPHDSLVPCRTYTREYDVILGIDRGDKCKSRLCAISVHTYGGQLSHSVVLRSGEHWASRWDGRRMYQTGAGYGH